jgi:hypothetical protein
MYSRLRTSLRSSKKPTRTSRKQRGGADYKVLDRGRWEPILRNDAVLRVLVEFEPLTLEKYILAVERQDTLFGYALKAVYDACGIVNPQDELAIIEALKTAATVTAAKEAIKTYFTDVANLVYFDPIKQGSSTPSPTKLQEIFKNPPVELLVNPEQAKNRFIQDLAAVCVLQKQDLSILDDCRADENIKLTRALRYEAANEANSYGMTSNRSRDGFYLLHEITAFRTALGYGRNDTKSGFWYKFLSRCIGNNVSTIMDDKFAYFAAYIYSKYASPDYASGTLKSLVLTGLKNDLPEPRAASRVGSMGKQNVAHIPPTVDLDAPVVPTVTMGDLLDRLLINDIQFILQLCYAIENQNGPVVSGPGGNSKDELLEELSMVLSNSGVSGDRKTFVKETLLAGYTLEQLTMIKQALDAKTPDAQELERFAYVAEEPTLEAQQAVLARILGQPQTPLPPPPPQTKEELIEALSEALKRDGTDDVVRERKALVKTLLAAYNEDQLKALQLAITNNTSESQRLKLLSIGPDEPTAAQFTEVMNTILTPPAL